MVFKLSFELVDVVKGGGGVICKKEVIYRMVEVNRVFVYFC